MSRPEVRTLSGRDELQALAVTQGHAFGIFRSDDDVEERAELLAHVTCRGAFVDGRMVGTAVDWTPRLSLPGGPQLTTVALSMIGVLPTHRRRGVMRELLDAQIAGAREQGIAVAALTASEATIYGRFGFGQSTVQLGAVEVDTVHGAFVAGRADGGTVRLLELDEALAVLPAVHERSLPVMPGDLSRVPEAWAYDLSPKRSQRRFIAVHEPAGGGPADGYAIYSLERRWQDSVSGHLVETEDMVWATPEAHAGLWRYLLDIDLVSTVRAIDRPLDDPIRLLLRDNRRARMGPLQDIMWLRLLDPAAALAGRGYFADGDVVLEVHDVDGGSRRLELTVSAGRAGCEPTGAPPGVELAEQTLAAAFLGGYRVSHLHRAGLVEELRPGAAERLDALLQGEREPWCSAGF
jgi:predicted acetyltransferase